jgi:hypothetical protein
MQKHDETTKYLPYKEGKENKMVNQPEQNGQ